MGCGCSTARHVVADTWQAPAHGATNASLPSAAAPLAVVGSGPGAAAAAATGASNSLADDPLTVIQETPVGPDADYIKMELVGKGSFGVVHRAMSRTDGEVVAIKYMDREKIKATSIRREWTVLEHVGSHPHVVGYKRTYKTKSHVSFVLEYMNGRELFEHIIGSGPMNEQEARYHMRTIAQGLAYLHQRGIIHRDLKPENILMHVEGDQLYLKIADFGLSQLIGPNELLLKVCGTWAYAAPEMSDPERPGYDCRFDCFSLGIILYIVLSGSHPFDPSGTSLVADIKARARSATFDFSGAEWMGISHVAKDLIARLIVRHPENRLDSAAVLRHPWFRDFEGPSPSMFDWLHGAESSPPPLMQGIGGEPVRSSRPRAPVTVHTQFVAQQQELMRQYMPPGMLTSGVEAPSSPATERERERERERLGARATGAQHARLGFQPGPDARPPSLVVNGRGAEDWPPRADEAAAAAAAASSRSRAHPGLELYRGSGASGALHLATYSSFSGISPAPMGTRSVRGTPGAAAYSGAYDMLTGGSVRTPAASSPLPGVSGASPQNAFLHPARDAMLLQAQEAVASDALRSAHRNSGVASMYSNCQPASDTQSGGSMLLAAGTPVLPLPAGASSSSAVHLLPQQAMALIASFQEQGAQLVMNEDGSMRMLPMSTRGGVGSTSGGGGGGMNADRSRSRTGSTSTMGLPAAAAAASAVSPHTIAGAEYTAGFGRPGSHGMLQAMDTNAVYDGIVPGYPAGGSGSGSGGHPSGSYCPPPPFADPSSGAVVSSSPTAAVTSSYGGVQLPGFVHMSRSQSTSAPAGSSIAGQGFSASPYAGVESAPVQPYARSATSNSHYATAGRAALPMPLGILDTIPAHGTSSETATATTTSARRADAVVGTGGSAPTVSSSGQSSLPAYPIASTITVMRSSSSTGVRPQSGMRPHELTPAGASTTAAVPTRLALGGSHASDVGSTAHEQPTPSGGGSSASAATAPAARNPLYLATGGSGTSRSNIAAPELSSQRSGHAGPIDVTLESRTTSASVRGGGSTMGGDAAAHFNSGASLSLGSLHSHSTNSTLCVGLVTVSAAAPHTLPASGGGGDKPVLAALHACTTVPESCLDSTPSLASGATDGAPMPSPAGDTGGTGMKLGPSY